MTIELIAVWGVVMFVVLVANQLSLQRRLEKLERD
jgi:hypothetical protein